MINLDKINSIYFIGIGGIGMSALARYFSFHGKKVSGYDRTETVLTRQLVKEGIEVMYVDEVTAAPKDVQLVVYTPAVPKQHAQLNFYQDNNYEVAKRSEVLGAITQQSFNICVAGTHGKTTISTMVAHVLRHTGYGCNAFLGGISANYNSNFWSSERDVCVIEADEYDRSFLRLSPDVAVITATDADHLDIYGTEEELQNAFVSFSSKIKAGGTLVAKKGLAVEDRLQGDRKIKYHLSDTSADVFARNIQLVNGYYLFDVQVGDELISEVALNMGGLHNVENASVAIAIARSLGIETEAVKNAVEEFRGVKRRFEYIVKKKELVYIDDYAHHPAELAALIGSAKKLFPKLTCVVLFQPHLFTRTRDFADGFAESLDLADEVILLPIYPARELPIDGVSSTMVASRMKHAKVKELEKNQALGYVKERAAGGKLLLITAGAGDIDNLVDTIKQYLTQATK